MAHGHSVPDRIGPFRYDPVGAGDLDRIARRLYGPRYRCGLARALRINRSTVYRWSTGAQSIPPVYQLLLRWMEHEQERILS